MKNRRDFIRRLALASTGLAASPGLFAGIRANGPAFSGSMERFLVVVELAGGNDDLNTVIPYRNDHYFRARPSLSVPDRCGLLKLNDEVGLHPSMTGLKALWDEGVVSIVQGVGYPGPYRSHFQASTVWQTGSTCLRQRQGWLAACLTSESGGYCLPAMCAGGRVPRALALETGGSAAKPLPTAGGQFRTALEYPSTPLGADLSSVACTIKEDPTERIFYLRLDGFDTHTDQAEEGDSTSGTHARLLKEVSDGFRAFYGDLVRMNRSRDVLIMTFSEFGRSVRENSSLGTDHGTSSLMFLVGGGLRPGLYGSCPGLHPEQLSDAGEMGFSVDFRSVFDRVISDWLGGDAASVLGKNWRNPALDGLIG